MDRIKYRTEAFHPSDYKEGMFVAVLADHPNGYPWSIQRVEEVTPKGNVITTGGFVFKPPHGCHYDNRIGVPPEITPLTEAIEEQVKRWKMEDEIRGFNRYSELTMEQLRKVHGVLFGKGG